MRLILIIGSENEKINQVKLDIAVDQLNKTDTIMYSGTIKETLQARRILEKLGVSQNRMIVDIKPRVTSIKPMKEYLNEYKDILLIAENKMEIRLIEAMYNGKLEIIKA